jgi:hypothetical protein
VPYDKKWPMATSVYVGETGLPPDERIQRHRVGDRGSKWVRNYPGALDRSLMPEVVLPNEATSKSGTRACYASAPASSSGADGSGGHFRQS